MIKLLCSAAAFTLVAAAVPSSAQTAPPPPPLEAKTQAAAYVDAAGKSDLYEINSSQIAVEKSQSPEVKRFAQMLIKHHQQTTAATMAAAKKAGMNPPPPALDPGASASIAELQSAAPADFDQLYLGQQVPAHQAALDLHKSFGMSGDQAPLKASAKKAVPIVQQHLTAAQKLMNGGGMAGHKI